MSLNYVNDTTDTSTNINAENNVATEEDVNLYYNLIEVLLQKVSELETEGLYEFMNLHSKLALGIYKRSVELELLNEQKFMNWQDELNAVSFVHKEDL